jgi:hypothetical protein
MLVGASMEILSAVVAVASVGSLLLTHERAHPQGSEAVLRPEFVAHSEAAAALSLVAAVVWIVMAVASRRRVRGARLISAILCIMCVKGTAFALTQPYTEGYIATQVVIGIIAVAVVVLLSSDLADSTTTRVRP